jgi:hypothetical protein
VEENTAPNAANPVAFAAVAILANKNIHKNTLIMYIPHPMYVVAIPTYNRHDVIAQKTLHTLLSGGIPPAHIYLFVANNQQKALYESHVPKSMYNEIVVGKLGITNQRIFISRFFPENQYVVSIDDDVEAVMELKTHRDSADTLVPIRDLDNFFKQSYQVLTREKLYIWGVYPVHNPFFMKPNMTTDLRFLIGVLHGYIVRHDRRLYPSIRAESKEDYEQTILYYQMDGGVVRFNFITPKTKFHAAGGLGTDRIERSRSAAEYLAKTYPDMISRFSRKNGMPEVKLKRFPRVI